MHADVAGCGVDRADEGNEREEHKMLGAGERYSSCDHQAGANDEQRAQVVARSNQSDSEREHGRAEQRGGRDKSDLDRAEPQRREIGRQDERREPVAKSPRCPRAVEIEHRVSSPRVAQHHAGAARAPYARAQRVGALARIGTDPHLMNGACRAA